MVSTPGVSTPAATAARDDERVNVVSSIPFVIAHLVPVAAFWTGVDRTAVILFVTLYWGRMFLVTAGYHRYFAHRSYRLPRWAQFAMAFGGTTAAQKGPLWWASHHRNHHRYADTDRDPHSPIRGFWWSHVGWILSDRYKQAPLENITEFSRFPELRFIDRNNWIGPWSLGALCFLVGGWSGLVVGFFASTVVLWHCTFLVNSVSHVFGRRRYATDDTSRNSLIVALVTGGEGWHNNHHRYPPSARQGFFWWEIDMTWYALRGLAALGIVRDLKTPSRRVREHPLVKDGHPDVRLEPPAGENGDRDRRGVPVLTG
jgi:stearoyl-CoA desaturase (delta-9 desaturase)